MRGKAVLMLALACTAMLCPAPFLFAIGDKFDHIIRPPRTGHGPGLFAKIELGLEFVMITRWRWPRETWRH